MESSPEEHFIYDVVYMIYTINSKAVFNLNTSFFKYQYIKLIIHTTFIINTFILTVRYECRPLSSQSFRFRARGRC